METLHWPMVRNGVDEVRAESKNKTHTHISQKIKVELPYDPATLVLDIYQRQLQSVSLRDICMTCPITTGFCLMVLHF